ncbi:MIZ zinc finger domain protein [Aspergillus clavatus NRRL 1]|uniref:MIZ zinc finger domain protein n=1 Tax=Aspergillus clavatus (strain ATCC 1007 / CBS 513.65 / DSM 816 / NCTC 3887 / NRRL 1 / QM 1276 / 107) TaxID=344612 RepID=A1CEX1_ASPCL|nr:MIZ zinc finger domain protein [Aspergillus clavatus NRRL 1]EAW11420.1 MIZ zinc finger domain protein [Aspergillus clavatus NRRL 1]
MSPSIRRNRSHLPNNQRSELEWSNSNSTANLFLGGVAVRRSWMLDASSQSSSSSAPAPVAVAATTVTTHHNSPPSSSPVTSAPTSASAAAVVDESGGRPQGMQNFPSPSVSVFSRVQQDRTEKNNNVAATLASTAPAATATTTAALTSTPVWMSPVTPGDNAHQLPSPSFNSLLPPVTSAASPTIASGFIPPNRGSIAAFDASQPSQASSLPSPDPSTGSHPSPASIGDRNDARLSQSILPSPPPAPGPMQIQTELQSNVFQVRGTMPVSASPPASSRGRKTAAPALAQGGQRPQVNATYPQAPVHANSGQPTFQVATAPSPVAPGSVSASPASPPTSTSFFDQAFWTQSQMTLRAFVMGTHGTMMLSETVEQPRIRLLRDACNSQDLLYLILHQIYCLHTFAPSEFARLPHLTRQHSAGFDVLKQLLVDNHRLSGDFLRWSVYFPRPLGVMLQTPEFSKALHQIANCLVLLSERWAAYDRHVRERAYPPLIDELVMQFGLTSTVLLSIVYLAMSRRIYGTQNEERLRGLFEKNKQNYFRRFTTRVTLEQMNRENEYLIRAYKSLSRPQTSPTGQHAPPTAGGQAATQPFHSHSRQHSFSSTNNRTASIAGRSPQMRPSQVALLTSGVPPQSPASALLSRFPLTNASGGESQIPYPGLRRSGIPYSQLPSQMGGVPAPRTTAPLSAPPVLNNHPASHRPLSPRPDLQQPDYNSPHQVATSQSLGISPSSPAVFSAPAAYPPPVPPVPSQQPVHQNLPEHHASTISARPPIQHPATQRQGQVQQPQQVRQTEQIQQVQQAPQPLQPPQSGPASNLLLPPAGSLPTNTARFHPLRVAVHQAHLRDPTIKWIPSQPASEKDSSLFQFSKSFVVPPTSLGKTESAFEWQFTLTKADLERLPQVHSRGSAQRSERTLVAGSQLYRLRCIRISPSVNELTQHTWCATDSVWPSAMYIFVNGTELFVRRKFHNGKDIPLDITDHLREGLNTISLHFIRSAAECNDLVYALAVEVMDILGFTQVKKLARSLPASDSRERIQKRLSSTTADDELSIVSDYITVNLVDPFMARIFNIPARGSICEHFECFDFETYIVTRASKAGKTGLKENWKCPICGADARPQNLVIDGFLANIHEELQRTNRLDNARAINIRADGSWELKADGEDTSERGIKKTPNFPSLKRKRDGPVTSPLAQRPKTESVGRESLASRESATSRVIELD